MAGLLFIIVVQECNCKCSKFFSKTENNVYLDKIIVEAEVGPLLLVTRMHNTVVLQKRHSEVFV